MSEAYERERQNNALLEDLAHKVTTLRGVTVDIYDNARDHALIDDSNNLFESFHSSLKNSVGRVRLMSQNSNKTQTLKLAGMMVGTIIVMYMVWGWCFG